MIIIQEIQTNGTQTALTPAITKTDRNEAESRFHSILAAAAISKVEVHTVIMYDEHGNLIDRKYYEHLPEPEEEPEAEPAE